MAILVKLGKTRVFRLNLAKLGKIWLFRLNLARLGKIWKILNKLG
jgi:hypothetical protein